MRRLTPGMTVVFRGSRRKAWATFARWSVLALVWAAPFGWLVLHTPPRDRGPEPAGVCGLVAIVWLICAAFGVARAFTIARDRIEIDDRELRRSIAPLTSTWPLLAHPLDEIVAAYAGHTRIGRQLVVVTRTGQFVIADRFDVPLERILEKLPAALQLGALTAQQRERFAANERIERPDDTSDESLSILFLPFAAFLAMGAVLAGVAAVGVGLAGLLGGWAVACALTSLVAPVLYSRTALLITPEWIVCGDWAIPAGRVTAVGRGVPNSQLWIRLRDGSVHTLGTRDVERRVREVLGLVKPSDDSLVYADEAALKLGVTVDHAKAAIAAAGLQPNPSSVGELRYRREDIDALRTRLR